MNPSERFPISLGDAMYSLRAIRRVKPDPIPDEDLRDILDAARQAPNGGNAQPWHFLVVRDADLRDQFGPLYREAWWAKRRESGFNSIEELPDKYRSAMNLAEEIGDAPVLIFLCAMAKGTAAASSVIPSAQNLLLAARALGIGGTITTLHPSVEERVHRLFDIPDTVQIVYCIPLGYPRGRFGPTSRKPLSEVSSYDRWGQRPI